MATELVELLDALDERRYCDSPLHCLDHGGGT